jgi:hypothetical protein
MRRVTVNMAESPVQWLASRGLLTDAQCRAGERLRADYERAGLAARVTMRWDAAPPVKSRGGARASDASLARIDAHRRFHAALDAAGPGLADICWRVICAGEGIGGAALRVGQQAARRQPLNRAFGHIHGHPPHCLRPASPRIDTVVGMQAFGQLACGHGKLLDQESQLDIGKNGRKEKPIWLSKELS